jgi:DNA/RNA-binding domain of Phe-tRNA-synthetase-like protein
MTWPEVAAWRRAYSRMGLKPTQYRSAAEALLRRLRREGGVPSLHPLVDLCNAVSLAFALPVAVFDVARIAAYLEVRHATGSEQHVGVRGEIESPEAGEVIFVDAADHAHARRWTFRQSQHSTVRPDTRQVLIVSEGLHPAAAADIPALLEALGRDIGTTWAGAPEPTILTAASPRLELSADPAVSPGRSPTIPGSMDVYGWLVGSWELEVVRYWGVDVVGHGLRGEVHFGWVLEGRAIQDVWIMPRRSDRTGSEETTQNMYGTTFRMWDPVIQAWRITWKNPAGGHYEEQIGRRIGPDIVQLGIRSNGTPTRWTFAEITKDSFRWLGDALDPDGKTWRPESEFRARRVR